MILKVLYAINPFLFCLVQAEKSEKKEKDKKKKKKKKHKDPIKKHEDDCYRCREGGELVMCDRSWCPKAYHLECLNLTKPPHGQYFCFAILDPINLSSKEDRIL